MARDKSAAKRAKRKVGGTGRGSTVRQPALHDPGQRAVQPPRPIRPRSNAAAAPTQQIVTLVAVEITERWNRDLDFQQPTEVFTLTARLSDGRTIVREASVEYAKGEREQVVEALTDNTTEPAEYERASRTMRAIIDRRCRAVEIVRGDFQREYGRGVPA